MPGTDPARHGCLTSRRRTRPSITRWTTAGLIGCVLFAAPGAAQTARTSAAERTPLPPTGGDSTVSATDGLGGSLLRLGLGLLVVVGLIVGIWLIMRRMQRGSMPGFSGAADLVDVVSTTPLGPNRFIHLVRIGGELVVIGATDHAITPVLRIPGEEASELLGADLTLDEATAAFARAADRSRPDARVRAVATSEAQTLVERLRALTTRR